MENKFIKPLLRKSNFSCKYIKLCNSFKKFKDAKTPTREVIRALNLKFQDLKYSSRDRCFYVEEVIGEQAIYLSISFNKGLIECIYSIRNIDEEYAKLTARFDRLATLDNSIFAELVEYNLPISTSDEDFILILDEVNTLHQEFILASKNKNFTKN